MTSLIEAATHSLTNKYMCYIKQDALRFGESNAKFKNPHHKGLSTLGFMPHECCKAILMLRDEVTTAEAQGMVGWLRVFTVSMPSLCK